MIDSVDPQNIVNPHPFTFTLNNEEMCGPDSGRDVFLLIYVHSALENAARRNLIRATWGDRKLYAHRNIRLIFVLGTDPSTPALTHMLIYESNTYNDIVQSTFIDNYRNLTYKAISALKWVSLYCRNAKFVLKSDDDILVNPFTLMTYLAVDQPVNGVIICKIYDRGKVFRDGYQRLVTREEYADEHYPPFCSGSAHLMTTDVVVSIYHTSYTVAFFWPDDVFITGLVPFKLNNITFVQIEDRVEVRKTDEEVASEMTGSKKTRYIFGHIHDIGLFKKTWSQISLAFNGKK